MDTISKEYRSIVMSQVRSKNTRLERAVADALEKIGKPFEQHANLIGKPDIVSKKKRVAIFLDSCFWHGCRWHCRMPSSKRSYWVKKIESNKKRAKVVNAKLRKDGWHVARFWEHQFQSNFDISMKKVSKLL